MCACVCVLALYALFATFNVIVIVFSLMFVCFISDENGPANEHGTGAAAAGGAPH